MQIKPVKFQRWTLVSLTLIFIIGFSLYTPRFVIDFWFFLKDGEFIVNHKFIPKIDPFSFGDTTYWLNHHWLSDCLFYLIYKNFSFLGLQIFKTIIEFLTLIILFKTTILYSKNLLLSSFLIILASSILNYFLGFRPPVITYLFLAILLFIVYVYSVTSNKYILLFLLPLMLFWVNIHGGFIIGFMYLFIFIICEVIKQFKLPFSLSREKFNKNEIKIFSIIIFVSLLLTLINPHFYKTHLYSLTLLKYKNLTLHIGEWLPPEFISFDYLTYDFILVLSIFLFFLNFKQMLLQEVILILSFGFLSVLASRNIPVFIIVCLPILSKYLDQALNKIKNKQKMFVFLVFILILSFTFYNLKLVFNYGLPGELEYIKKSLPFSAFNFLERNKLKGKILNEYEWGGFFIWKFYPKYKVAIDGRFTTVYKPEYIKRFFDFEKGKNWDKFLRDYKINIIFFSRKRYVVKKLLKSKNWINIYYDKQAVIFLKNTKENKNFIDRRKKLGLLLEEGFNKIKNEKIKQGIADLKKALEIDKFNVEANTNLGVAYAKIKKFNRAIYYLKKAVREDKTYIDAYYNLAIVYLIKKDYENARIILKKILKIKPDDEFANENLKKMEEMF